MLRFGRREREGTEAGTVLLYSDRLKCRGHSMSRIAAWLVVAVSLAGCDVIGTLIDGWKYAKAVETDLEASVGMKPEVGFKWTNGQLSHGDGDVSPPL